MVKFTIPGHPVGLERARTSRGRFYTPSKSLAYKNKIALFAKLNGIRLIDAEIGLRIVAYFKKRKFPDLSNVVKIIEDALRGIAYKDDNQIAEIHAQRIIDKDKQERCEVEIWSRYD